MEYVWIGLLAFFLQGTPDGRTILSKVEAQVGKVKDYTVTLDVVADIERLKVPPMHATMYYKHPDKVFFDTKGFAMLPRESMGLQFGGLSRRYAVDSVRREGKGTPVVYRLVMHPRDERTAFHTVYVWINGDRWTPERLEIPRSGGKSMRATFRYEHVQGFWLPTELTAQFDVSLPDSAPAAPTDPFSLAEPSTRATSRGNQRTGQVTVRYSDYRVNTGLPDDIFMKPEGTKE